MPLLDKRLQTVASQIRSRVHADIGSDHAYLLKALLASRRIQWGIAIEKRPNPYQNSLATLAGLQAEVRLADGLGGLAEHEADSLSLCGMGGRLIRKILSGFPNRVPDVVILQPNDHPEAVRRWGLEHGFHLVDEQLVHGRLTYVTLRFCKSTSIRDPAYDHLDPIAATLFGPHLIGRSDPELLRYLQREHRRLAGHRRHNAETARRFQSIERLLAQFD